VVTRRISTAPQLPQTGIRLGELLRIALVLMTLGVLALIAASTPLRDRGTEMARATDPGSYL
jgi:Tfp pilus assembly protein PilV